MRLRFLLACLLTGIINAVGAVSQFSVRGMVTDSTLVAEPYATIRIFTPTDTVKPIALGVSGDNGAFSVSLKSPGNYSISVSSIGKETVRKEFSVSQSKPMADVGTIVLTEGGNMLGEVFVTAQKPLVSKEIDRIGYDVQEDPDASSATVQEILRKVPLVSVEADGTIKVKGSSNFKIYKNGRPNNTYTNNAKEIFAAIPASTIKKIEVITDPGAREDAEGVAAILNIVTIENTVFKGVMGNASVGYNTNNDKPDVNLWLSTQVNKVTFSFNGGVSDFGRRTCEHSEESEQIYDATGDRLKSNSLTHGHGHMGWGSLEGSYELDSLNLFTVNFGGYFYSLKGDGQSFNTMTGLDGNPIYSYGSNYLIPRQSYLDFSGGIDYQHTTHHKGETITASYLISTTGQRNKSDQTIIDPVNVPFPYSGIHNDFDLNFIEHTFQLDWSRPFGKWHKLDVGGKYILRDNHSNTTQDLIGLSSVHDDFSHITDVGALYADYRFHRNALSLRGGLRYEYSHLSAKYHSGDNPNFSRTLNDFVPNLSAAWDLNDQSTVKAAFSTRIYRPGISYLNPAVNTSPTMTSQGNPMLKSARYYIPSINYSYMGRKAQIDATLSYTFTNSAIAQFQSTDDRNHTFSTYYNNGHNKSVNLACFLNWTLSSKTSWLINASVNYDAYKRTSPYRSLCRWSSNIYTRLGQQLPWKLRAELTFYYTTGYIEGVYGYGSDITPFHGLSLQRQFLKGDRLTVKLAVRNPIGNGRSKATDNSLNSGLTGKSVSTNLHSRSFEIKLSYRFGSLQAQVKKTAVSIENDDLVGRKK